MDLIEFIQEISLVVMILARHRFCLCGVITKTNITKPNQILSVLDFLMFISIPGFSVENPTLKEGAKTESSFARVVELETRLNEIKSMDIKSMSRNEKK